MLCEKCQRNEANCHITTIIGGHSTTENLCNECHEPDLRAAREFAADPRDARCEYCGGQPCTIGTDIFAIVTGVQKSKFMCFPCSLEYSDYIQQQLPKDASGLSQDDQLKVLRTLSVEVDRHLKQWVSAHSGRCHLIRAAQDFWNFKRGGLALCKKCG